MSKFMVEANSLALSLDRSLAAGEAIDRERLKRLCTLVQCAYDGDPDLEDEDKARP